MKKLIVLIAALTVALSAAAQGPRSVGGYLGVGIGAVYQHSLSETNMVTVDLDVPAFAGFGVGATYDWLNPAGLKINWDKKGEWNWYAGVGACFNMYGIDLFGFGVTGRVGIEYVFDIPLGLFADLRPTIGPEFYRGGAGGMNVSFGSASLYYSTIQIGARYMF